MTTEDILRLNFYERQFLGPRDFQDEQAYHIAMRRRHLIAHHTWGIVVGLDIQQDPASEIWSVAPGLAVDGYGREIVVFSPERLDIEEIGRQLAGVTQPIPLKIWLQYVLEETQRPAPGYEVCGQSDQFVRLRETFRLVYQDDPPGFPWAAESLPQQALPNDEPADVSPWPVLLGTITWDPATKKISATDPQKRVYVGNITSEVLAPARGLLIRDRATNTPLPQDKSGVAVKLEGSLQVERLIRASEDLRVGGKLGIGMGNSNIDTPLHIKAGTDADLPNGTGFAVVGKLDDKNLVVDDHAIQARNNQAISALSLQPKGGNLNVHRDKPGAEVIFKDNGNVGIGTQTPSERLEVQGTVKAIAFVGDGSLLSGLPGGQKERKGVSSSTPTETSAVDWTDLDRMNLTIQTGSSPVLIMFQTGGVQALGSNGDHYRFADFRLLVDDKDEAYTRHEFYQLGKDARDVTLLQLAFLQFGSHTVRVQWRTNTGNHHITACYDGNRINSRHLVAVEL